LQYKIKSYNSKKKKHHSFKLVTLKLPTFQYQENELTGVMGYGNILLVCRQNRPGRLRKDEEGKQATTQSLKMAMNTHTIIY
jgi:hypothetical protein